MGIWLSWWSAGLPNGQLNRWRISCSPNFSRDFWQHWASTYLSRKILSKFLLCRTQANPSHFRVGKLLTSPTVERETKTDSRKEKGKCTSEGQGKKERERETVRERLSSGGKGVNLQLVKDILHKEKVDLLSSRQAGEECTELIRVQSASRLRQVVCVCFLDDLRKKKKKKRKLC